MLWGKLGLAFLTVAVVVIAVTGKYESARRKYQSECQSKVSHILAANPKQNQAGSDECKDAKEYMPWGYVLVAWPEGLGAWVVILTLIGIFWQSNETHRAAEGALLSAEAVLQQARITEKQLALMFRKERGFLEINGNGLETKDGPDHVWNLVGDIQLTNSGNLPLRVFHGEGECLVVRAEEPVPSMAGRKLQKIGLPNTWIRPKSRGSREEFWSVEIKESKTQFARLLIHVEVQLILRGRIDYESHGSAWRRFYGFTWISDKSKGEGGITKGQWVEDSEQENEEYEIPCPPQVPF